MAQEKAIRSNHSFVNLVSKASIGSVNSIQFEMIPLDRTCSAIAMNSLAQWRVPQRFYENGGDMLTTKKTIEPDQKEKKDMKATINQELTKVPTRETDNLTKGIATSLPMNSSPRRGISPSARALLIDTAQADVHNSGSLDNTNLSFLSQQWLAQANIREKLGALEFFSTIQTDEPLWDRLPSERKDKLRFVVDQIKHDESVQQYEREKIQQHGSGNADQVESSVSTELQYIRLLTPWSRANKHLMQTWHKTDGHMVRKLSRQHARRHVVPRPVVIQNRSSHYVNVDRRLPAPRHYVYHPDMN